MLKSTKNMVDKIVEKVVDGVHPQKIVLFGSSLGKTSKKINDLDFLIVKPSNLRRDERDSEIRQLLSDIIFPMDIFVYTPEEVNKYGKLRGSFINKIMERGKTLYESK